MNADSLKAVTEVVYQYGPFAFSLIFLYSISRWAYKRYDEASKQNPPVDPDKERTTRAVYLLSFAAGLALVAVSVGWWFVHHPVYVFRGTIKGLDHNTHVSSTELYFLDRWHTPLSVNDLPTHDEDFIAVNEHPFHAGQKFSVDFGKNDAPTRPLNIDYDPHDGENIFRPDFRGGQDVLVRDSANLHAFNWVNPMIVHAQESVPAQQPTYRIEQSPVQQKSSQARPASSMQQAQSGQQANYLERAVADTLSNSRSSVGAKIVAIEKLEKSGTASTLAFSQMDTNGVPLIATLLDLTRHSDRELAYEASTVVRSLDVEGYLRTGLKSRDPKARNRAEIVLGHMNPADREKVMHDLRLPSKAATRIKDLALVPTNFPDGDRYYMQITWNPNAQKQGSCLASFFSTSLDVAGTPNQEAQAMEGRGQRLIYSVYKDWVVGAAATISKCGAKVAYVRPSSMLAAK